MTVTGTDSVQTLREVKTQDFYIFWTSNAVGPRILSTSQRTLLERMEHHGK